MSLLEQARTEGTARRKGPDCDVQIALRLHPELADEIAEVIRDRSITQSGAARVFGDHHVHILKHTIGRHRDNDCLTCRQMGVTW